MAHVRVDEAERDLVQCGLRGLADRVDALGGSLEVDSPAGGGTVVRARVPCGT